MGLFASSILVKYSLLNNSGSLVYAGTSSNSLRIWGAQLELAEYSQEILDNYINNYRYTRTTGQLNQNYYYLYNYRYGLEQNPDTLLIGSGIPGKVSGGFEPIPFWVNLIARQGAARNFSSNATTATDTDRIYTGQQYGSIRFSYDPNEILAVTMNKSLASTPTLSDDRRRIPSNPVFDATRVAGIELVKKTSDTFSYNRYTPVAGDNVYYNANDWFSMVGRSQRARMAIGNDTQVNFIDKRLDETKQIPRIAKFDALRVMGLEPVNKTSSVINLAQYTPLRSNDITYYKKYDWFSITPRSQYAKLAYGIGDGSPYILDAFSFGDVFTYTENKGFAETLTLGYGVNDQTSRLPGSAAPETFKFLLQQNVKRGVGSTIVINNRTFTTSDAVQTQEIFYNKPGSPFNKQWYKLAPYYSQFSHILDGPGDIDSVHVGQYYPFSRQSGTDQERMSYIFIKGTFYDSTTMIDNMMILGENATYLQNKGLSESVGVGTPQSLLAPFVRSIYTADQTLELFYNNKKSPYGKNWYLLAPRPSDYLSRYGLRLFNNPYENVKFTYLMTANRSGTSTVTRIPITQFTQSEAASQVSETFYNKPNSKIGKQWYQLAPYYKQFTWVYNNDSDPFELITVGSRSGVKTSNDPYETIRFLLLPKPLADTQVFTDNKGNFVDKRLDETKPIPQVAKFDALRVMGLEPINKTSSIINLAKYTPLRSTDYTYYKKYDWFSISPRSQVAKQALGIGDGSPYILDTFLFGDVFTYNENKFLSSINVLVGSERTNFYVNLSPKRGKDDLITINNRHQTSSDAIQTQEVFYNKPGSIFGKAWYQLAPYYSSYYHLLETQAQGDNVRVGDYYGGVRHSNNRQETMAMWFAPKPRAEITLTTDTVPKFNQKTALRSSYSSTTIQTVIRTNRISYSERLDRTGFWGTTGATITTSTVLLSPLLPYRAVGYDADQLHELFYNQPRQPLYKKWYTLVPLTTRTQSWTSNAINIVNVTSSNSQHGAATLINFNIGLDNYYSYGMFVKQRTGVNRVRLYVGLPNLTTSVVDLMGGSVTYDLITDLTLPFSSDLMELSSDFEVPHYADFDLVAGTVLNRLNVSYANITDRGNGWWLIKIAGPVSGTADSVTDTLPVFRDFVSIRDSLELSSALFDLAPADLLVQNGAVDLTDAGGIEELL
jgi:hypothetical protein